MQGKCKLCGSMAINPHLHGRDDTDLDLCDVCYWQKRVELMKCEQDEAINSAKNTREMLCKIRDVLLSSRDGDEVVSRIYDILQRLTLFEKAEAECNEKKPLKEWTPELKGAKVKNLFVVDHFCIVAKPEDREHFRCTDGLLHRYDSYELVDKTVCNKC